MDLCHWASFTILILSLQLFRITRNLQWDFSATSTKIWRSRLDILVADLLGNKRSSYCDLRLVDFNPFCMFLSLLSSVACFWKALSFTVIALSFLSSVHWNIASKDFSYRASKFRRNTDMGGWKRIGTFSLTFTFAASAHYCRLNIIGDELLLNFGAKFQR